MAHLKILVLSLLALAGTADAGWRFWGRFKKPWIPLIKSSYNITRSVEIGDADGDGFISQQEYEADFLSGDLNGDGRMSRCEFVRFYREQTDARMDVSAFDFDLWDADGDNYVTAADVSASEPVTFMDRNRDGKVSRGEYRYTLRQDDLMNLKKVACEPNALYRLPPNEVKKMKKKCAMRKKYNWW